MIYNKVHKVKAIDSLRNLEDGILDAVITDPPFEVSAQSWDKGFIKMLPVYWPLWVQKSKPNAPFIFKATMPFANDMINSNRKLFKYEWLWIKDCFSNFVNARRMPFRAFEYLLVFYKQQPTYHPELRKTVNGRNKIRTLNNKYTNVYSKKDKDYTVECSEYGQPLNYFFVPSEKDRFDTGNGSTDRHPNRTPPDVWKKMLTAYTNPGDLVWDGFAGSASVAEACIDLDRNFIACETDDKYFEKATINIQRAKDRKQYGFDKSIITADPTSIFFNQNI